MSEPTAPVRKLILASSSPYRRELLTRLRLPFEVVVPALDETPHAGETAVATASRLALEKARAVALGHPHALVIGSDQVALLDERQLGKPGDHTAALAQLQQMRGRSLVFHTAVCVFDAPTGHAQSAVIPTYVRFRPAAQLSDAVLETYLRAEKPYDVAGSAKAEGLGIALLESIQSDDPTALIGLPLIAVTSMLNAAGMPVLTGSGT